MNKWLTVIGIAYNTDKRNFRGARESFLNFGNYPDEDEFPFWDQIWGESLSNFCVEHAGNTWITAVDREEKSKLGVALILWLEDYFTALVVHAATHNVGICLINAPLSAGIR